MSEKERERKKEGKNEGRSACRSVEPTHRVRVINGRENEVEEGNERVRKTEGRLIEELTSSGLRSNARGVR